MPTIVDSLLVELGLDSAKFVKGQKDAVLALDKTVKYAEKSGKEIEDHGKRASSFFSNLKREALELFAVYETAKSFINFTENVREQNKELGYAAQRLNLTTQQLSSLQGMANLSGTSVAGLTGTLGNLKHLYEQFITNPASMDRTLFGYLSGLHLNIKDFEDVNTVLLKLAEAVDNIPDPSRKVEFLTHFGIDQSTINLLIQGADNFRKLRAESEKQVHVSAEAAKAAQDLTHAWGVLSNELYQFWSDLSVLVNPALEKFLTILSDIIVSMTNMLKIPFVREFIARIANTGPELLGAFKQAFGAVFDWLRSSFNYIWEHVFGFRPFGDVGGMGAAAAPAGAAGGGAGAVGGGGIGLGARAAAGGGGTGPGAGASRSARNHNPGNIKYGPFAISHGAVGQDEGGFAKFASDEAGAAAHRAWWEHHRDETIGTALPRYSGGGYSSFPGVDSSKRWSDLSDEQKNALLAAQKNAEGWSVGAAPTSGTSNSADRNLRHPFRYQGRLRVGNQTFDYASGGGGAGSSPYGEHPITGFDPNALHGRGGGAFRTTDVNDPQLGRRRSAVEIHMSHAADVDNVRTAGCFGIPSGEWSRAKEAIKDHLHKYGPSTLRVHPNGDAEIVPQVSTAARAKNLLLMHHGQKRLLNSHSVHDQSQHSSSVNVGNVNVHTSATDAGGIARDMREAMERDLLANHANFGLA